MAGGFTPMGGMPEGYGALLQSAQQQLVRMPDGTLVPMPQFGGATSVEEIYRGIIPSAPQPSGLTARSVNTVPIDPMTGNPIPPGPSRSDNANSWLTAQGRFLDPSWDQQPQPTQLAGWQAGPRSGAQPAITQGVPPAGSSQMAAARPPSLPVPPNNFQLLPGGQPPTQVAQAMPPQMPMPKPNFPIRADGQGRFNAPPGPIDLLAKNQDRLPTNAGEAEFMAAFGPQPPMPPAVAAATAQAGGVPLPRARPTPPMPPPRMPMAKHPSLSRSLTPTGDTLAGATNFDGSPVQILAPQQPGAITVQRGDTATALAKRLGMSVPQFAAAYGIKNPDRLYAGETLRPGGMQSMPAPRQQNAAPQRRAPIPQPPQNNQPSRGYTPSGNAWFDQVTGRT
jgi:hypothetical protein